VKTRRHVLKGAVATAASVALPAPIVIALADDQACGCPRVHEPIYGHTCTTHDERGRRWDNYTAEDVAAEYHATVEFAPGGDDAWHCYCHRYHDGEMAEGTPCVWEKASYEYDEWDCKCLESVRDDWLHAVTTDWIAMAKESGMA
jgi:hypothetical protein